MAAWCVSSMSKTELGETVDECSKGHSDVVYGDVDRECTIFSGRSMQFEQSTLVGDVGGDVISVWCC